jgi:hypothetical protein
MGQPLMTIKNIFFHPRGIHSLHLEQQSAQGRGDVAQAVGEELPRGIDN